jgi:Right handed beta helix region
MVKASLRTLAPAALAVCALAPVPAAAVTPVSACQPLDKAGETYVLTADITAAGFCFIVRADRITLDLAGHTITGAGPLEVGIGVWDEGVARSSTVVKNGSITAFNHGIDLEVSSRSTVRAVTASDTARGMILGQSSLVKDCVVPRNGVGVVVGDRSQVEGCVVGGGEGDGSGGVGIAGQNRVLVTRNTVIGSGDIGIAVGANSTVSHNTVSESGNDGISVGPGSLVTSNTSNDNGGDGIEAVCPSTITHNTALDNGDLPINPPTSGNGCVLLHNTTSDGDNCSAGDSALAAAC